MGLASSRRAARGLLGMATTRCGTTVGSLPVGLVGLLQEPLAVTPYWVVSSHDGPRCRTSLLQPGAGACARGRLAPAGSPANRGGGGRTLTPPDHSSPNLPSGPHCNSATAKLPPSACRVVAAPLCADDHL